MEPRTVPGGDAHFLVLLNVVPHFVVHAIDGVVGVADAGIGFVDNGGAPDIGGAHRSGEVFPGLGADPCGVGLPPDNKGLLLGFSNAALGYLRCPGGKAAGEQGR